MIPIRQCAESLIELPERLHGMTLQKIATSAMFCAVRPIWSSPCVIQRRDHDVLLARKPQSLRPQGNADAQVLGIQSLSSGRTTAGSFTIRPRWQVHWPDNPPPGCDIVRLLFDKISLNVIMNSCLPTEPTLEERDLATARPTRWRAMVPTIWP